MYDLFYFHSNRSTRQISISSKPKDLPYETVLLNLINFDQLIFGESDCELVALAQGIYPSFEVLKRTKNTICYVTLNTIYTDWYQLNPSTGAYDYLDTSVSYGYVSNVCTDISTTGIPSGNPSGGGPGSSSADPNPYDNIDPSSILNVEKLECLYNKFMEGNNSLFNQTIAAFGKTTDVNLIFRLTNKASYTDSYKLERNNEITIYINPDARSTIDLAGDLSHEGIYAAIAVYLNRRNVDVTLYNKERLLQLFKFYKGDISATDHFYMSETYINRLAKALRQIDGYKSSLESYKPFAWDGLRVYGKLNGIPDSKMYNVTDSERDVTINRSKLCK